MGKKYDVFHSRYGMEAQALPFTPGKIFYVFNSSDEAYIDFEAQHPGDQAGEERVYTSLASAYAACVSNRGDIIILNNQGTHTLSEGLAWTKNRIRVIGLGDDGDRLIQQGAKVQSTDEAGDAYVLKNTGTRNSFENIKFIQVDTDAAALTCVQMGGEGNLYKNCSFTFGVADNLDGATTYEVLCGEDSGTFINCEFGQATLLTSAARAVMAIDQVTASQEMKDCRFKDCNFVISSSDANANFIRVLATTDCKFAHLYKDCTFLCALVSSASAAALTDAVDSVSGLVEGNMFFVNPATNCTNFSSAVTDQITVVGPSMADSGDADVSATVGIAQTPT